MNGFLAAVIVLVVVLLRQPIIDLTLLIIAAIALIACLTLLWGLVMHMSPTG